MPSNELIQRRLKVIELADKGLTNKEIANELGISTSTVSSDKKAYHNNPNAYKKTVKKTTKTTSKPSKPANKQTITNENKTTTASTANNTVNASTANNTVKTTDKTVKTAHDDTVSTTADNDKTLPAVNTDTTKTDDTKTGTVKIKETATTSGSENTVSNADIDSNNSNSSNASNADNDSNDSISGDDIVNDVNDMMDKAIHDFQGKLHNIAVEARKEMGLPTDTAPEYGNESPSDNSQSDADNANITTVNTTNAVNTESDGNHDNVSNANNVSANTSTSRLVKSHVVSPDNIITNSGIITGINNSSQHSYDHSIIANMIGSNDTNAYNVFKNLNDKEKWDAKEQEKSNSYVRGFLTGGFIIAIIGIILNILF